MTEAALDLVRGSNLQQVSRRLADDVAGLLRQAISERGRAVLAVPGGTTPRAFLTLLGQQALPWSSIMVLPTDERAVPPDDPRSNERMIRECLPIASKGFLPLRANGALADPAQDLATRVAALGQLDAVVLGMGADAHIASLFPGDARLARAMWEIAPSVISAHPLNLEPRLSLGPPVLMTARWQALLIAGSDKLEALARALALSDPVAAPVRLLFEAKEPPRIYFAE